jgi:hypothetical protein
MLCLLTTIATATTAMEMKAIDKKIKMPMKARNENCSQTDTGKALTVSPDKFDSPKFEKGSNVKPGPPPVAAPFAKRRRGNGRSGRGVS